MIDEKDVSSDWCPVTQAEFKAALERIEFLEGVVEKTISLVTTAWVMLEHGYPFNQETFSLACDVARHDFAVHGLATSPFFNEKDGAK